MGGAGGGACTVLFKLDPDELDPELLGAGAGAGAGVGSGTEAGAGAGAGAGVGSGTEAGAGTDVGGGVVGLGAVDEFGSGFGAGVFFIPAPPEMVTSTLGLQLTTPNSRNPIVHKRTIQLLQIKFKFTYYYRPAAERNTGLNCGVIFTFGEFRNSNEFEYLGEELS